MQLLSCPAALHRLGTETRSSTRSSPNTGVVAGNGKVFHSAVVFQDSEPGGGRLSGSESFNSAASFTNRRRSSSRKVRTDPSLTESFERRNSKKARETEGDTVVTVFFGGDGKVHRQPLLGLKNRLKLPSSASSSARGKDPEATNGSIRVNDIEKFDGARRKLGTEDESNKGGSNIWL